jgi:hypothetical protein
MCNYPLFFFFVSRWIVQRPGTGLARCWTSQLFSKEDNCEYCLFFLGFSLWLSVSHRTADLDPEYKTHHNRLTSLRGEIWRRSERWAPNYAFILTFRATKNAQWHSVSRVDLWAGQPKFDSRHNFQTSRPDVGPTHYHIQRTSGAPFPK